MKKRLAFIDLLRGWSLIVMIEVHVFNAMLRPELKQTFWFDKLNFVNGLVAPTFLFISGFAFYISSRRKMDEFRKFGYQFWRQIGRIALIWVIGYLLHLPFASLTRTVNEATRQQMDLFYGVDVLQCIAVGLLLLFILRILIKNDRVFNIVITALSLIVVFGAPVFWKIDFAQFMPVPIADYFNPMYGSLFPLSPWLGFMMFGAVFCSFYLDTPPDNEKQFLKQMLVLALILVAAGIFVIKQPFDFMEVISKPRPNAFFFFLRLGLVILLLLFFRVYELKRKTEKSFVLLTGRESLLVYWLHLQIIYRPYSGSRSLNTLIGQSFGPVECIVTTIIFILLMVAAAKIWEMLKSYHPKVPQVTIWGSLAVISLYFFLK